MEDLLNIYRNVHIMFKYRNVKSEPKEDAFLNNYKFNSFYIETAENNIIIFADVEYVSKLQDFRKLMKYVVDSKLDFNKFDNFIFISEDFMSSNVNKQMGDIFDDFIYTNKNITKKHVVETLHHRYFAAEIPKGPYSSKHTILNEAEAAIVLDEAKSKKNCFPKLRTTDPMAVWIGARQGNIVKIESVSDGVGMAVSYKITV